MASPRASALLLLGLLAPLASSGCGDGPACQRACAKLAQCLGVKLDAGAPSATGANASQGGASVDDAGADQGWTCPYAESECSAGDGCRAKCVEQATCGALTGKVPAEVAALRHCQAQCQLQASDAGAGEGIAVSDPLTCTPSCAGRQCGDDGCGGSCGLCIYPQTCGAYGKCVSKCTPSCAGRECGSDGCGGSCGSCPTGSSCSSYGTCSGSSSSGCGSVSYEGCCSGSTLKYCSDGELVTMSCASSPSCGWSSSGGLYDCGTTGGSDPSGLNPKSCY